MNRYTIYCTEEQTKKALELGAPTSNIPTVVNCYARITGYVGCKEKKKDVIIDIDDI